MKFGSVHQEQCIQERGRGDLTLKFDARNGIGNLELMKVSEGMNFFFFLFFYRMIIARMFDLRRCILSLLLFIS